MRFGTRARALRLRWSGTIPSVFSTISLPRKKLCHGRSQFISRNSPKTFYSGVRTSNNELLISFFDFNLHLTLTGMLWRVISCRAWKRLMLWSTKVRRYRRCRKKTTSSSSSVFWMVSLAGNKMTQEQRQPAGTRSFLALSNVEVKTCLWPFENGWKNCVRQRGQFVIPEPLAPTNSSTFFELFYYSKPTVSYKLMLSDKFDQFWAVNRRLMESVEQEGFKNVPLRCYNDVSSISSSQGTTCYASLSLGRNIFPKTHCTIERKGPEEDAAGFAFRVLDTCP